jgi:hypothetical protein
MHRAAAIAIAAFARRDRVTGFLFLVSDGSLVVRVVRGGAVGVS